VDSVYALGRREMSLKKPRFPGRSVCSLITILAIYPHVFKAPV
jgi:hypothetical protein